MRYIPEWLPWISYKPLARIGRDIGRQVIREPIQFVRESMVSPHTDRTLPCCSCLSRIYKLNGTARPSLALVNLQEAERLRGPEREKSEKTIQEALASMYAGW